MVLDEEKVRKFSKLLMKNNFNLSWIIIVSDFFTYRFNLLFIFVKK